jgi:hypothetical protein
VNNEKKIETTSYNPGAAHDAPPEEIVQVRADLKSDALEALGYAALAGDCLRQERTLLASDMFASAAAALAQGAVRPRPRSPVSKAVDYGALALDALNRGNREAAIEMFDYAAAALRESVA